MKSFSFYLDICVNVFLFIFHPLKHPRNMQFDHYDLSSESFKSLSIFGNNHGKTLFCASLHERLYEEHMCPIIDFDVLLLDNCC